MEDMTADALERLEHELNALSQLATAYTTLSEAFEHVVDADHEHAQLASKFESIGDLLSMATDALRERAMRRAHQIGWQIASYEIAPVARDSGDEPITWLTSNRFMPPLRDLASCERVWQAVTMAPSEASVEFWEAMVDSIDSRLGELRVYMAAPDYDNALYVVDLARFEYRSDEEMTAFETAELSDEWKPIEPS